MDFIRWFILCSYASIYPLAVGCAFGASLGLAEYGSGSNFGFFIDVGTGFAFVGFASGFSVISSMSFCMVQMMSSPLGPCGPTKNILIIVDMLSYASALGLR